MRLIDADAFRDWWLNNGENEHIYDTNDVLDSIDNWPTLTLSSELVSAKERLPKNHAQVVVWSVKWDIAELGSYYCGQFWVYNGIVDAYTPDEITYWMSVPRSLMENKK